MFGPVRLAFIRTGAVSCPKAPAAGKTLPAESNIQRHSNPAVATPFTR
jgi:hypothetical protein